MQNSIYLRFGSSKRKQLKRYCSKSVLLKKWELLNLFRKSFIRDNELSPFDSESLATLRFEILRYQKRMTLKKKSCRT